MTEGLAADTAGVTPARVPERDPSGRSDQPTTEPDTQDLPATAAPDADNLPDTADMPVVRQPGAAARPGAAAQAGSVSVIVATRNRVEELCRTLGRLAALPEQPPVIVVDNASTDGTSAAVRERFPATRLIRLPHDHGAWARNVGAARAMTPYVAFSDDDSWWAPGSLRRAAEALDAFPRLGLVAGRTLVGPAAEEDPLNAVLAASPLPGGRGLPGPRVLGFLGCAAVARRRAFLEVGGYRKLLRVGGEERFLAADLAAVGWVACYLPAVVARHFPSSARDAATRRRITIRNDVLFAWLRRPFGRALASTAELARQARRDPVAARALAGLLLVLPRALPARRPLPRHAEADLRLLESLPAGALEHADAG